MTDNKDMVNRPSHYTQYKGFEVMDVCVQLNSPDGKGGWHRANAFKYLARAGWKDPEKEIEDLQKAAHYLQREIDRLKMQAALDQMGSRLLEEPAATATEILKLCPVCQEPLIFDTTTLKHPRGRCPQAHGYAVFPKDQEPAWVDNPGQPYPYKPKQTNEEKAKNFRLYMNGDAQGPA